MNQPANIVEAHPIELVQRGNEPRVDSRLLAKRLGIQHRNVLELIERYKSQLQTLGVVPFQTEKPTGPSGGRPERYALLNEDQAFYLLTLSRNTKRVAALKLNLVKAFGQARRAVQLHQLDYLPGYHELHEVAHALPPGDGDAGKFLHMNLNKLVNHFVGVQAGQRGNLPAPTLSLTVLAQNVAAQAMRGAGDAKEGYQYAKAALSRVQAALMAPGRMEALQ